MRRIPCGGWTAVRSVAAGRASSCPPARVAVDCVAEIAEGTVAGAVRRAARVAASIRMTGATSVAAGAITRATAAAMGGEVAEDADVKDPAAAALDRVHANCALVRAATAVGLPVAAAGTVTVTPVTVAPGPRRRRSAIERPASVRSAVATPSRPGAPFRRPVPAAGPEHPGRCPDPDLDRTAATETPTTTRWAMYTHNNNIIMTH